MPPQKKKKPAGGKPKRKTPEARAETSKSEGRKGDGSFAKGNKIGNKGGRPPALLQKEYLDALKGKVSKAEWEKVVAAILAKAQDGDVRAMEALSKHVLPSPEQRIKMESDSRTNLRVSGKSLEELNSEMVSNLLEDMKARAYQEQALKAIDEARKTHNN